MGIGVFCSQLPVTCAVMMLQASGVPGVSFTIFEIGRAGGLQAFIDLVKSVSSSLLADYTNFLIR